MRERILRREQVLEAPLEEAFEFFSRAENLEAITPPLLQLPDHHPESDRDAAWAR